MMNRYSIRWLCCSLVLSVAMAASTVLMDSAGTSLRLQQLPDDLGTSKGVVAIVTSPNTPSLLASTADNTKRNVALSLESQQDPAILNCRGATLSGSTASERMSLATTSLVATAILLDGITQGDVEAGLRNSRHARTLTALFRARMLLLASSEEAPPPQALLLIVKGQVDDEAAVEADLKALFDAVKVEDQRQKSSFGDLYTLQIQSVETDEQATEALALAFQAAQASASTTTSVSLSSALSSAATRVSESGVGPLALDGPRVAQAFLNIGNAHAKQTRAARARIVSWQSRVARGLTVDGFGGEASTLLQRCLAAYDGETLAGSGMPVVAPYRMEMRSSLQDYLEDAIQDLFQTQVANLQTSTRKKFRAQLLKHLKEDDPEATLSANAAALRNAAFTFDTTMEDLEIPSLGLTKAKASSDFTAQLNDELLSFPDSPEAQLQRTKQVKKVTSKEKKPGDRGIGVGVDLVAMLRPDGFGSLQGFAGYQLPGGHSVTFGIHNDADDPQVIAQFGGVRPPLIRVQPKLRLDVEL